jgi:aminotransferase
MKDAVSLGIGEPDFVTPWHIREAAIYSLEQGRTSYTDNRGLLSLRKAVSAYVEKQFGLSYRADSEVLVAVGVSEAMDIALRAVLSPGDKVLYHEPCYVSYMPSVVLAHGQPIGVPTKARDQFTLDPEALEAAWEPGCKALVLNFPTNPTGGVIERERLERIARFAVAKDLVVISDEIYAELTFEGEHVSIATLPGMRERTIFLHGVSKAFAMTGWRIGYACAPAELTEAMMKVHQYCMMCASIMSQEAAREALTNGAEAVARMKEQYDRRRQFFVRRMNELGLPCHLPRGTFYTFPDVSSLGMSSVDFATDLLRKAKVALVPGTAFGPGGEGFVRASYSMSYESLLEASERIARYLETARTGMAREATVESKA